jgi:mRNA interferase MazF
MVSPAEYIPKRGDVVRLTLNPQVGHEQAGRRPVLVLSPEGYNKKVGLALFCPLTNQIKGYPFEVIVPSGLSVTGVILADQVKGLDWRGRQAEWICSLPPKVISEVLQKLRVLLEQ